MKQTRVTCIIAALAFLTAGFAASSFAADTVMTATIEMLCFAPWKVSGMRNGVATWSRTRTFNKDGTFTTQEDQTETGTWKIGGDAIILTFMGNRPPDTISLPLDPAGTPGADMYGGPVNAVESQQPPEELCRAVQKESTSINARLLAYSADNIEQLCAAPWKISGELPAADPTQGAVTWSRIRIFQGNGTFTTRDVPGESGTWSISRNMVTLTFADNHTETISMPLNPNGTPGIDGSGRPTVAVRPPVPVSPELQQKAAELVKTYHKELVFVTGSEASGSGFIAVIGKGNFLITNAHVAADIRDAAFKTLDDAPITPGAASVAIGRDIFCMAQPAGGTPLEIMQDFDKSVAVGDEVVVLGNAEGEGVVNTLTGRIVAITPDQLQIDAPFVPGNSGSPIIQLKSGKVIGIATYHTVDDSPATGLPGGSPVIRRFGYRLDNVKGWQNVDWRLFYTQAMEMEKIDALTAEFEVFFHDLDEHKGAITPDKYDNPVIRSAIDEWRREKSDSTSSEDRRMANQMLLSSLKSACQSDVTAARRDVNYDYFLRDLASQQKERDEMAADFEKALQGMGD